MSIRIDARCNRITIHKDALKALGTNAVENYFTITALHTGIIWVLCQLVSTGRITLINLSLDSLRSDITENYTDWVYTCQIQCRKGDEIKVEIMNPLLNSTHQPIIRNYY